MICEYGHSIYYLFALVGVVKILYYSSIFREEDSYFSEELKSWLKSDSPAYIFIFFSGPFKLLEEDPLKSKKKFANYTHYALLISTGFCVLMYILRYSC